MDDNKKGKRYCCFRSVEWIEKSGVWRITRKKWTMVSSPPKDETRSVAENHSSNNHQRGQCQQHQIILLSHKKTMYKQFQLFSILNCRFLATIWSIQNYNGWLGTLSENTIWMMNECWNYHGLLRTKMIKWVNGVCSFFATFRLLQHFLGYFSSAPQKVSDTQSIIELMMLDFVLVGIHCFQRFCVVLHYIAFNNSPCLVNIHALLKLFNAKPYFL